MDKKYKENLKLVGKTGQRTTKVTVIDFSTGEHGVDVRVKDEMGEVYWTSLSEIELDD